MKVKLQTVYLPVNAEDKLTKDIGYYLDNRFTHRANSGYISREFQKDFKSVEAIVLSPDELKALLEEYTQKIVDNAEAIEGWNSGLAGSAASVNKESITQQLPEFLKEILP